jgi:hypothetical protein
MATKKKNIVDMPGTIGGAKIVLSENKPSEGWPKITQGSHLTVKTFQDGKTELVWDDAALLRDVQNALTEHTNPSILTTTATKVKKTKK